MVGSAVANRVCSACPTGTFSTSNNATACTAWRSCGAGQFVSLDGSSTQDRSCASCAAGTFSSAQNSAACTAYHSCTAGQFVMVTPSSTRDRGCASCASGQFSTAMNAASCTAWSTCEPGTYVGAAGTASADRVCTNCQSGTYSSSENAAQCVPAGQCAAGTRQTAPATSTMPATCAPCPVGWYCPGGTNPGGACGSGSWDHDMNSASACAPWSNCSAGRYISPGAPGSTTADRQCTDCAAGTFSTVKIQSSISIVLTYNKAGHKISLSMSGTDSLWLAKGIGKVREILTSHTETNINGRRKVEDGICKDALRSYTSPTTP